MNTSNFYWRASIAPSTTVTSSTGAPAYTRGANPETMRELLQMLQEELGGATHWLQSIGVEAATIEQLQAALLE